jgi:hypothetical protein
VEREVAIALVSESVARGLMRFVLGNPVLQTHSGQLRPAIEVVTNESSFALVSARDREAIKRGLAAGGRRSTTSRIRARMPGFTSLV